MGSDPSPAADRLRDPGVGPFPPLHRRPECRGGARARGMGARQDHRARRRAAFTPRPSARGVSVALPERALGRPAAAGRRGAGPRRRAVEAGAPSPRALAGGQRQRVGVARAPAAERSLLLMDEPFGALDPVTRRDLQLEFLALRSTWTKTSLFVTHDVREALALATRIALLHGGRLEIVATPREFLAEKSGEARIFLAALEDLSEA